jgi:hypothetical protein
LPVALGIASEAKRLGATIPLTHEDDHKAKSIGTARRMQKLTGNIPDLFRQPHCHFIAEAVSTN